MLFTLLTWARTSETRFCQWDEFEDLGGENALWRISPERMKMEREHLVPLSTQVSEMLLRRKRASNDRFVFPGEKTGDRKSVVSGRSVSGRVDLGGRRFMQQK